MSDVSVRFWNAANPAEGLELPHYLSVAVTAKKVVGTTGHYTPEDLAIAVEDDKWKTHDGSIWDTMGVYPHAT